MAVKTYMSEEKIHSRLDELALQINRDYEEEELIVVGVLNGSFILMADLVRRLKMPIKIDFITASSYGNETTSSGRIEIRLDLKYDIKNKNILIVEDIVDTGLTLSYLKKHFEKKNPASLKFMSLLYKPSRNVNSVTIDYLAFEIEDHFVVGYGLDYAGRYRELPYLGIYSDD